MNMASRSFTPISCIPTSCHRGRDRFGLLNREDADLPSEINLGLCNLTALSQIYNLYICAYRNEIFVYRMDYPGQSVPREPVLRFETPKTRSAASEPGGVYFAPPHTANNVKVDFLGIDEIFLVAYNDGDVLAYSTRSFHQAACDRTPAGWIHHPDGVRPLFHQNVGDSVWGLSIHSRARMIAVSSNKHVVTVFAFGLSTSLDGSDIVDDPNPFRTETKSITYDADWLILHDHTAGSLPHPFEDEQASTQTAAMFRALLKSRTRNIRFDLPRLDSNLPCVAFRNSPADPEGRYLLVTDVEGWFYVIDVYRREILYTNRTLYCGSDDGCTCNGGRFSHAVWGAIWCEPDWFTKAQSINEATGLTGYPRTLSPYGECLRIDMSRSTIADMSRQFPPPPPNLPIDDLEKLNLQENSGYVGKSLIKDASHPSATPIPSCPILQICGRSLFLHQPLRPTSTPIPTTSSPPLGSTVFCNDPTFQSLPDVWPNTSERISIFDRLCYHAHIPSLGLFILGSPAGRVFIGSLASTRQEGEDIFSFRMDAVVPFRSQEEEGRRPLTMLVGIAVAPIQGFLGAERGGEEEVRAGAVQEGVLPQRWRLVLQYRDFSILTYELRSPEEYEDWVLVL
ncbi:hypothetical protein K402DRAFT_247758 [Aulographum hederae CBS 113979]|uniref:Uncharacterized protein n=1 Tax=Aulographum hederae CBS 113979 TaxID=1176131 RepID=A0A6G1HAK5_9PEZI|nr:hypothetical protein K402DRAFT_247758 [Aulographum hederae CBS 113979]